MARSRNRTCVTMPGGNDIQESAIRCYSQRLLNPFRGAVNVIRYKSAEAVTSDGIQWDIYVSNAALLEGLDKTGNVQISDIRYGRWSREQGLTRGPVYPSDEFFMLEKMGSVVYQHLLSVHDKLPFPFLDSIELWLLDRQQRPLALLNAVVDQHDIDDYQLLDWRAGRLCKQAFSSESTDSSRYESAADQLIGMINGRAGSPPAAQWFDRKADGSAVGLHGHHIDPSLVGRTLGADAFPEFFISAGDTEEQSAALVEEFIAWQAPWLLLLHTLGEEQRRYFEQCARTQALIVDQQYLLYPEVVDESFLRAARVEAQLRRTQMQEVDPGEVMSTFYIELHPAPTE